MNILSLGTHIYAADGFIGYLLDDPGGDEVRVIHYNGEKNNRALVARNQITRTVEPDTWVVYSVFNVDFLEFGLITTDGMPMACVGSDGKMLVLNWDGKESINTSPMNASILSNKELSRYSSSFLQTQDKWEMYLRNLNQSLGTEFCESWTVNRDSVPSIESGVMEMLDSYLNMECYRIEKMVLHKRTPSVLCKSDIDEVLELFHGS